MDRRRFLQLLTGAAASAAVAPAIPFNRVWSFPTKLIVPRGWDITIEHGPIYSVGTKTLMINFDELRSLYLLPAYRQLCAEMAADRKLLAGQGWIFYDEPPRSLPTSDRTARPSYVPAVRPSSLF